MATLRAQMEDLARGERIKARRTDLRLTQPAVVDLLERKAGAPVVTLRGYQAWEAGGGIRWDNAKVLAEVLGMDAEQLMIGGPYVTGTPDLFPAAPAAGALEIRLAQIEELLIENNRLLKALAVGPVPLPSGTLGRVLRGEETTPPTETPAQRQQARAARSSTG